MTPSLFTGKRIKGARYCLGLGISFSRNPTHLHLVSLSSIAQYFTGRLLTGFCFRSGSPTHSTFNQSCLELVVKISLTRPALLSRFVFPFPSPLLVLTTSFCLSSPTPRNPLLSMSVTCSRARPTLPHRLFNQTLVVFLLSVN